MIAETRAAHIYTVSSLIPSVSLSLSPLFLPRFFLLSASPIRPRSLRHARTRARTDPALSLVGATYSTSPPPPPPPSLPLPSPSSSSLHFFKNAYRQPLRHCQWWSQNAMARETKGERISFELKVMMKNRD